ncbi:hypothetical protein PGB90_001905 [Kerria lacca]
MHSVRTDGSSTATCVLIASVKISVLFSDVIHVKLISWILFSTPSFYLAKLPFLINSSISIRLRFFFLSNPKNRSDISFDVLSFSYSLCP